MLYLSRNRTKSRGLTTTGFHFKNGNFFFLFFKADFCNEEVWKKGAWEGFVRYQYAPRTPQIQSLGMLWLTITVEGETISQ